MMDREGPEESEYKKQRMKEIQERLAKATPMVKYWLENFIAGLEHPIDTINGNRNEVWAVARGEMDNPYILKIYEDLTPDEVAEIYFVLYGESLDEDDKDE